LQTYGDENDSLEVGDDGAARLVFNDGGGAPASRVVSVAVVEVGFLPPSYGLAQKGLAR
jgi:hypothetical protein